MKNKIVLALCAVAVTSVILVGCGSSDKEPVDQPAITEEVSGEVTPVPTEEPVAEEAEDQSDAAEDADDQAQESGEAVEDELAGEEILEESEAGEQTEDGAEDSTSEEEVSENEEATK